LQVDGSPSNASQTIRICPESDAPAAAAASIVNRPAPVPSPNENPSLPLIRGPSSKIDPPALRSDQIGGRPKWWISLVDKKRCGERDPLERAVVIPATPVIKPSAGVRVTEAAEFYATVAVAGWDWKPGAGWRRLR
jgi:hypothetical protein